MGGSFNPPHAGHRAISLFAMKRLGLDRIWWLVTPGNPLKDGHDLPPIAERTRAARLAANHPRIEVTDFEASIDTRYTYDTLRWLLRRGRGAHFVWIMGADNLASFSRWRNWRDIAGLLPIAVVDRFGASLASTASEAALALTRHRIAERDARPLVRESPPAWTFLRGLKSQLSSSEIRRLGG